jgi:hypothetical protein
MGDGKRPEEASQRAARRPAEDPTEKGFLDRAKRSGDA